MNQPESRQHTNDYKVELPPSLVAFKVGTEGKHQLSNHTLHSGTVAYVKRVQKRKTKSKLARKARRKKMERCTELQGFFNIKQMKGE